METAKPYYKNAVEVEQAIWGAGEASSGKRDTDENFPVGSLLFAQRHRRHILAYYNFARAIDDIADDAQLTSDEKRLRLGGMQAILEGERDAPLRADARKAAVLRQHLLETGVPFDTATDLLIAFRQDAEKTRYKTWEELLAYCRYSANPVGRFLLLLHGEKAQTLPFSDSLCSALQILNHLQDVTSDFEKLHRSYLPESLLAREGVAVDDVGLARAKPGLRRVFDALLDEVEKLNHHAGELPGMIRDRRMRAYAAAVLDISRSLTRRLRQQDPVYERVELTRLDKARAFSRGLRALVG